VVQPSVERDETAVPNQEVIPFPARRFVNSFYPIRSSRRHFMGRGQGIFFKADEGIRPVFILAGTFKPDLS
jgi:hypothetical protein